MNDSNYVSVHPAPPNTVAAGIINLGANSSRLPLLRILQDRGNQAMGADSGYQSGDQQHHPLKVVMLHRDAMNLLFEKHGKSSFMQ